MKSTENPNAHESQIRAARGLLRWSAEDIARRPLSGLPIRRAEGAENETSMTAANDLAVRMHWRWRASSSSTRTAAVRGATAEGPTKGEG